MKHRLLSALLGLLVIGGVATSLACGAESSDEQGLAFPGVEGAGRFATGGRGGQVVHVTNLNADGPGSFADAVSGPNRIVVFDVSGIIDLNGDAQSIKRGRKVEIEHPNITIAGQTAPGEGICLKGGMLTISADNVIVRYLRSRRGWNEEGDTGDAIQVKPRSVGEAQEAAGLSQRIFDRVKAKKAERGKIIHEFGDLANIVIDHCSTSWATDENLTVTHCDRSTVSWSIAAEGLDYPNPKQTPPNHSEGSLWGSEAPDGRSTMHHMLYAHNRLRNPRTTGGDDTPAVFNFYNNVVYNWHEYASHTGSQRVLLNWLNNYYKAGPNTPAAIRATMFEFHGDPEARIFARGNSIFGSAEATTDNKLAISHNQKFRKMLPTEREAMKVDAPFPDAPAELATAEAAFAAVLYDVGATLPARDAVDWRIVGEVATGDGRIREKETDLPVNERWPDYRSLPPLDDADGDGLPNFWERQFGLDPHDPADSAKLARGYANVEHFFNNTDPTGSDTPLVWISATISRARPDQPGQWRVSRSGSTSQPLEIRFEVHGDAKRGRDYAELDGSVMIPAGQCSATIALAPLAEARDDRIVIVSLATKQPGYHVGCPARSLIVIRGSR